MFEKRPTILGIIGIVIGISLGIASFAGIMFPKFIYISLGAIGFVCMGIYIFASFVAFFNGVDKYNK